MTFDRDRIRLPLTVITLIFVVAEVMFAWVMFRQAQSGVPMFTTTNHRVTPLGFFIQGSLSAVLIFAARGLLKTKFAPPIVYISAAVLMYQLSQTALLYFDERYRQQQLVSVWTVLFVAKLCGLVWLIMALFRGQPDMETSALSVSDPLFSSTSPDLQFQVQRPQRTTASTSTADIDADDPLGLMK